MSNIHELELQIRCKSVKWKFRLPWNGYCPLTSYNRSGTWDVAARRGNRLQAMSHRAYVIGRVKPGDSSRAEHTNRATSDADAVAVLQLTAGCAQTQRDEESGETRGQSEAVTDR